MTLFPPRREIQVNYDWIDLVSATGYVLFDGIIVCASPATSEGILIQTNNASELTPAIDNDLRTEQYSTGALSTSSTYTQLIDEDFDTNELELPRTLKGICNVRVSYVMNWFSDTTWSYIIARLRKYSVATGEVEIASVTTGPNSSTADEEFGSMMKMAIPLTHFKKGETIRLTIEVWAKNTDNTASLRPYLAHNPNDTGITDTTPNFTVGNSRLVVALPFRLDFL